MPEDGLQTPPRGESAITEACGQKLDMFDKLAPMLMPTYVAIGRGIERMAAGMSNGLAVLRRNMTMPCYDQERIDEAVQRLVHTRDVLDNKIGKMRYRATTYGTTARLECDSGNRNGALHQLRLKNMYEREATKLETLRFNIETNILHMESVSVMVQTVSTIKETSTQFKSMSGGVDIGKLESSIEEIFEQNDTTVTIENMLNDMNGGFEIDNDAVMEELESMLGTDTKVAFPSVPAFEPLVEPKNQVGPLSNKQCKVLTTI